MLFLGMSPVYALSDGEESAALSREEGPQTWRFVLCSLMVGIALATALAFFVHHFVWPVQVVGDIEHRFTWRENMNSVTVHGFDGSELYELSGRCYVRSRGKVDDGRSHPGPAVVTCYDEGVPFRYLVREGMSFTMGNTGGSYGWEKPRATIRVAGSTVVYGLSEYNGRDNG